MQHIAFLPPRRKAVKRFGKLGVAVEQMFEIAMQKVEYTGELEALKQRFAPASTAEAAAD